jgi:Arc/MetJ-type ribon-helix-helix transcriptional regulator
MSEFVIRLGDKQEDIVKMLIKEGYFNTKSEVIRAGLLELYNKYFDFVSKEEVMLVNKAINYEMQNINSGKTKLYSLDDVKKELNL